MAPITAVLALCAAAAPAPAQQRLVVPLSDPGRPATLEVSLVMGEVNVHAYDGNEVVILVEEGASDDDDQDFDFGRGRNGRDNDDEERDAAARRAGLRRIPNTALGLTAEERDNTVTVKLDFSPRNAKLDISVPRRTSVRASLVNGGDVSVTGVTGSHELSNVNGDVFATDIAGSAVVGTTNGDVEVSFTELTRNAAMSFSSFNGDVDVALPPDLSADLWINSGRGDVYTDFEFDLQPQEPVIERGGDAGGRYHVRMERRMHAVIGGGGPELRFRTFNGDIMIRKR
ncbi:MAG TPA: DUF4097 family beta strand repeat-containing protein [Gammaproteobacteria bacterium]